MYLLTPPGRLERTGINHPLFGRMSLTRGVSLLKENGVYRQVENPSPEEAAAADIAYLGGHSYEVSSAEAAALTAAGYGFLISYHDVYSMGIYNTGVYGG